MDYDTCSLNGVAASCNLRCKTEAGLFSFGPLLLPHLSSSVSLSVFLNHKLDFFLDDVDVIQDIELHHGREAVVRQVGVDEPPDGVGRRVIKNLEVSKFFLVIRLTETTGGSANETIHSGSIVVINKDLIPFQ